ncbi:MAG: ABC transporter substrate-binding protein [Alphaproteobacteria bacterium]|nr:ABC transporter substrate-binding protein [Alphaproteobacteria bacterium]
MRLTTAIAALLLLAAAAPATAAEPKAKVTDGHALSLADAPKYGPGFTHLEYVDPDAPKGGEVRLHSIGSFDSFNPYVIKGSPAAGLSNVFETLMVSAEDDILTEYGLIAKSVEVPEDLSYVTYTLREEARFHDGTPITADDVVFSLNLLKEHGQPFYRFYYANIARAEKLGPHRVKFHFSGPPNRELPQITGQLPVLSRAYWSKRDFTRSTMDIPVGSGPYRIKSFEPGRFIVYERVEDWWGKDLPINRGRYNFGTIRYDFYRDPVVALEAFKAHKYDFRLENSSKDWATGYNFPARRDGAVRVEELPHDQPTGMQAFAFNLRRDKFRDPRVRQALGYAFDFEWSNQNLFYGQYTRTKSYFSNSELAAREKPSEAELKLLEPLRGKVPDEVFTTVYEPPSTDGSGIRPNLRKALLLLRDAGWLVKNNRLIDPKSGQPLEIEFLLVSPAFERVVAPFLRNLERLGVRGQIRVVDSAQYLNRLRSFDFDVVVQSFGQSASPGNEQRDYWHSEAADRPGSQNVIGIENPAVDALVKAVIEAPNRASLIEACRALDRVLLWNHYLIPQWHIRSDRVAWWDRFGRPDKKPAYGVGFNSWWVDVAKPVPPPTDAPRDGG